MLDLLVSIFLLTVLFCSVSILKVYMHLPARELKRRAQKDDKLARLFHRAVAYGASLEVLLWLLIGIASALLFVIMAQNLPSILALLLSAALVWLAFVWVPIMKLSPYMVRIAQFATPVLHWLLEHLHPVFAIVGRFLERRRNLSFHTGMFSKEDLLDLIEKQKIQVDNRITEQELYVAAHALQFGDKKVGEVMTPRRMIKYVNSVELIGPVLMDELHESGHSRFPVYEEKQDNIVGTLYLRDMLHAKAGGFVKSIMRKDVFYVHEQQSLARVLDAFLKTKHHLFLVVNNFEEVVGVISIEDIVEQILGKEIIDEFDQYDDLRAVAHMEAEKDRESHTTVVESEDDNQSKEETQ